MKIVIFERVLTHYRLKFYNFLVSNYDCEIIFLTKEIPNSNGFNTDINNTKFKVIQISPVIIFGFEFYFFPLKYLNKNYILILLLSFKSITNSIYLISRLFGQKIYWWGHSQNFQKYSYSEDFKNFFKILMIKLSSGVLAYTSEEKNRFISKGIKNNKIIILNNTVDTDTIFSLKTKISAHTTKSLIKEHSLKDKFVIGLIGRLHVYRNTEKAILAITNLNKIHNDIVLLIIGDGTEKLVLEKKYKHDPNITFIGSLENEHEISKYMTIIKFFINPGLVGLNLVHAMSYGKSSIIIKNKFHSPEIDYLINNFNGIICKNSTSDFEQKIKKLIFDHELRNKLNDNAYQYVKQNLTIQMMSENFLKIK